MIAPHTLAALWVAQVQATNALALAMLSRPWIEVRDVYLPFGAGYSQDIDPVTLWWLPLRFGLVPGSRASAEMLTRFGEQQALVRTILARAEAGAETPTEAAIAPALAPSETLGEPLGETLTGAESDERPAPPGATLALTETERALLAHTTERLGALTGLRGPGDAGGGS